MPIKGSDVLMIVNKMHDDKKVAKEVIFSGIEAALQVAIERSMGEEVPVQVSIDRLTGTITAKRGETDIDPEQLGRIPAQSAKNLIIQKIREAESDQTFEEFQRRQGEIVTGTIQRIDQGSAVVTVNKTEALLPRSEQIPGETFHVQGRVRAVVMEVRRTGHRVRIILSRCHPDFVRCLFEQEIPEIQDRTIEIKAVAREAGYRTKIAVSSIDSKVDAVGACVGVRGSRIKNIIDELGGERIDIVRWNDSLQVLIPNALQPAEISEVFLYPRLGRAIVLVAEDQLSLAIGRRGQNVRLASKLVGWDIEIMTVEELDESLVRAEEWFNEIPGVQPEMIEAFITEGFLSYRDLTFFDPADLATMISVDSDAAEEIIEYAEERADEIEEQEEERIAQEREAARQAKLAGTPPPAEAGSAAKQAFDSLFAPSTEAAAEGEPAADSQAEPAGETPAPDEAAISEPAADGEAVHGELNGQGQDGAEGQGQEAGESAETGPAGEEAPAPEET
jgi:transcription termination/antitermination protein NusA